MKKVLFILMASFGLVLLNPNLIGAEENSTYQDVNLVEETEEQTSDGATEDDDSELNEQPDKKDQTATRDETPDEEKNNEMNKPDESNAVEETEADNEEDSFDTVDDTIEKDEAESLESKEQLNTEGETTLTESDEMTEVAEEQLPENEEETNEAGETESLENEEEINADEQLDSEPIKEANEKVEKESSETVGEIEKGENHSQVVEDEEATEEAENRQLKSEDEDLEEDSNDSENPNTKQPQLRLFSAQAASANVDLNEEEISELEESLNRLGFNAEDTTNLSSSIEEFQEYYGLNATGKVNQETLDKIDEILAHPLQKGNHVDEVIPYKQKLNKIGYDGIAVTDNFGSWTEKRVIDFQKDYLLPVSGIIEMNTGLKIDSVFASIFSQGSEHENVREMKMDLNRLGFDGLANADTYGSFTTQRVADFQEYYGLEATGDADLDTLNKIEEILDHPLQKGNHTDEVIPYKQMLNHMGYDGIAVSDNFASWTEKRVKDFQKDNDLPDSGIIEEVTASTMKGVFDSIFNEGSRHESVREMKMNLNRLGFDGLANADLYGSFTTQRVADFQGYYDLEATGDADLDTLNKIEEILDHPLQKGNHTDEVIPYKQMLNHMGYDGIAVSDNFASWTEKRVKDFQKNNDLPDSGIIEEVTASTMKSVFDSIFSEGSRHESVREMKMNLNRLGFDGLANAELYGSYTTKRVADFQDYYSLEATGKADLETLNKMNEILDHPLQNGKHHEDTIKLKEALNALGYNGLAVTTNYASFTEQRVQEFQRDHGLPVSGIAEKNTFATILEVLDSRTYTNYDLSLAEALEMQMNANPQTDQHYAYVSNSYINGNGEVTASVLNIRSGPGTGNSIIGQLTNGTSVNVLGEYNGWYQIEYANSGWKDAAPEDVLYYLDPTNFVNDGQLVFQFLDLSKPSNTSATVLNNYLEGKGILEGQGQAFIDASKQNGVSDIYLMSHALLETGNGTSALATGIEVNGQTVYNMYGIGANDGCALECGSQRAYDEGWFTPYDAIIGGAEFIGNSYIKAGQNTLYEMRWNPAGMEGYGYATHQYATDIGWATKQVSSMHNMYNELGVSNLVLDIPRYV